MILPETYTTLVLLSREAGDPSSNETSSLLYLTDVGLKDGIISFYLSKERVVRSLLTPCCRSLICCGG